MPSIETIYKQNILPLPPAERVKLAEMILKGTHNGASEKVHEHSAFELLESLPSERVFTDSAAVDDHLLTERESWDN